MNDKLRKSFKFFPLQFVTITLYGLEYRGRVVRCIFDGAFIMYDVDYAANGELKRREFYEDEIGRIPK